MDDGKKLIMGIDTGTEPVTVVVVTSCSRSGKTIANERAMAAMRDAGIKVIDATRTLGERAQEAASGFGAFGDALLKSLARALDVPFASLSVDYARSYSAGREYEEFRPTMAAMKVLQPALHARINALLGGGDRRQAKRGSRLFSQWKRAHRREIAAMRARELFTGRHYDDPITSLMIRRQPTFDMGTVHWPAIDPGFVRELTAEKLTVDGWKKPVITNPPWAWPGEKKESDDAE